VFAKLYEEFGDDIELKVFSSFGLYGWPQRDKPFEELFKALEDHPGVDYNKAVDNATVRRELASAHIFAYPSIWQETSCLCLIEAMSAGLTPVHSSLAALPETSMGLSVMYDYKEDLNLHANIFYAMLRNTIKAQMDAGTKSANDFRKIAIDAKHDLNVLEMKWKTLVNNLTT
jgi:glycosyltransferase involved in cell wall biosynthesis